VGFPFLFSSWIANTQLNHWTKWVVSNLALFSLVSFHDDGCVTLREWSMSKKEQFSWNMTWSRTGRHLKDDQEVDSESWTNKVKKYKCSSRPHPPYPDINWKPLYYNSRFLKQGLRAILATQRQTKVHVFTVADSESHPPTLMSVKKITSQNLWVQINSNSWINWDCEEHGFFVRGVTVRRENLYWIRMTRTVR